MSTLRSLALAGVILIVAVLLIALQQYRVMALQGQLSVEVKGKDEALAANQESQATITSLLAEARRNADYQADLSKRLKASEQKAQLARKNFEQLKRTSKPVRDWAAQPLPDGLRSKPASTGQDDDSTAGAP